jgi:hypothetical protein
MTAAEMRGRLRHSAPGLAAVAVSATSARQVDGVAVPWPEAPETCDPGAIGPVDYILAMPAGSGDLVGCIYGIREPAEQRPGGTINVPADEVFIGCLDDVCGSFLLRARITNKWDGPPGVGDQIDGRCQHKIVSGTGTGDFVGVEGRLDFKDIIVRDERGELISLSFAYRGHLSIG